MTQDATTPQPTPRSQDPDGWTACYSDHAHDIEYKGECDFCGSADPDVIGHVLPGMRRYTGKDPVAAAEIVILGAGAAFFDGILLDHFSASAVHAVHEALGEEARAKLRSMSLVKAVTICFKLIQ